MQGFTQSILQAFYCQDFHIMQGYAAVKILQTILCKTLARQHARSCKKAAKILAKCTILASSVCTVHDNVARSYAKKLTRLCRVYSHIMRTLASQPYYLCIHGIPYRGSHRNRVTLCCVITFLSPNLAYPLSINLPPLLATTTFVLLHT